MVSGIVYVFMGDLWFVIGHVQLSLPTMGGGCRGIDNYRLFNYLSDLVGNWLEDVYMCQDVRMIPVKSLLNQTTH